jgi:hypothetical protein
MIIWGWRLPIAVRVRFRLVLAVGMVAAVFGGPMYARCVATNSVIVPEAGKRARAQPLTGQPLKMTAFGTSLMWDNGLKNPHSFGYLVAKWLSEKTARPVALTTFAHSSALLGPPDAGATLEGDPNWGVGDLNSSEPTVHAQIDCAAGLPGTADADLILMEGCINEVGAETIPLPWTNQDELRRRTEHACGEVMTTELTHLAQAYPRAMVVVVGYYPLVSRQSITGWFRGTERLKKHAKKAYAARHPQQPAPHTPKRSHDADRDTMADNSELFYKTSKHEISKAVDYVDANVLHSRQMIFAPMPEVTLPNGTRTVDPNFAFGAPKHRLWWVPIPIIWHWAFFADEKYGVRHNECNEYVKKFEEKLICPVNVAFHPNVAGAKMYADSIEAVIPQDAVNRWMAAAAQSESPAGGQRVF